MLDGFAEAIPDDVYEELRSGLREATTAAKDEEATTSEQIGILGPLATAGIATIAYQHELKKQFASVVDIIARLRRIKSGNDTLDRNLSRLADDLDSWLCRAKATNALFDPLSDAENVQNRTRLRADPVIADVIRQTEALGRGIEIERSEVLHDVRLPEASLVEWSAVFQNVFINAFNAMLDSEARLLKISCRARGRKRCILVQDTGKGVDLATADDLFKPFVRKLKISRERQSLGYGGTGLGLTIVKLIAERLKCRVGFEQPEAGFKTAFVICWEETS